MSNRLLVSLGLSCLIVSCNNNGAKPADEQDTAAGNSSNNSQDATVGENSEGTFVAPEDRVLELTETVGRVSLKAKLDGGEEEGAKISARVEIIKDGAVDQQAQGTVVFRLAGVEILDEELEYIAFGVAPCEEITGDDDDFTENPDVCDDNPICGDENNCPIEKSLVKGVATLFAETEAYDITEFVSSYKAIEVQATYKNPPASPETVKKRFELASEE